MAYTLTQPHIDEFEGFLQQIPESMVRSNIEKWWYEEYPTTRITTESLDKLTGFNTQLPPELQAFIPTWIHFVREEENTENAEYNEQIPTKSRAKLEEVVEDW